MADGRQIKVARRRVAAWAACLALAACAQAPACRPQLEGVLAMERPFTLAAHINGRPARLLIDTGSYENVLTTAAVTRLALRTDPMLDDVEVPIGYALHGLGGRRHTDRTLAALLEAPGLHRQGVPFVTLWSGYAGWDVDGLLGMNLLADYDLDLDEAGRRVLLYHAGSTCGAPPTSVALLQRGHASSPLVAAELDGRRMVAAFDTGAEHSILFAGGAPRTDAADTLLATGIGPLKVGATLHRYRALQIGALTLDNVSVINVDQARPGDADLLLGMDFFRRVHVILSPAAGTAWLQYPPLPSPDAGVAAPAG